jgi:hypothetical protein
MKAGKLLINGAHLEGIRQLLELTAPGLSDHVRTIVQHGPVDGRPDKRGQHAFMTHVLNLPTDDAKAVLAELERAKMIYGDEMEFYGFRISALAMAWNGQTGKQGDAGIRTKNRNQQK